MFFPQTLQDFIPFDNKKYKQQKKLEWIIKVAAEMNMGIENGMVWILQPYLIPIITTENNLSLK